MSTTLFIVGPTLALYLLGVVFYTAVETGRDLRNRRLLRRSARRGDWDSIFGA